MILSPIARTRLEQAAEDSGFDLARPAEGGWLPFGSSQAPLLIWIGAVGDGLYLAALSQQPVLRALGELGATFTHPLPPGAVGARSATSIPALHALLRRAWQLSRALPDEPLRAFERRTAGMPKSTEAERLVVQRVGQDIFRAGLLDYWQGRCAVTGLAVPELLRASHIKRWADCEADAERLDVYNGLLLAPNLDALFDLGFVTVEDDGRVVVSGRLGEEDRVKLGVDGPLRVRGLADGHQGYLKWHRERWFGG